MRTNRFDFDKAKWQYDSAADIYCRQTGKAPEELTDEDCTVIWEYGANHIAFFLTWLIENDLLSSLHNEAAADIGMVKSRQMTGFEYLERNCDMALSREDLSRKIVRFADHFYYDYCGENGYCGYMENELHRVVLGTRFSWDDYDAVKRDVIDAAYKEFLSKRLPGRKK